MKPVDRIGVRVAPSVFAPSGARVTSGVFLAAIVASTVGAQTMPPRLTEFLAGTAGFTPKEITQAAAGTPIVKVLKASDQREVPLIGAVRVDVPRTFYVARVAVAGPTSSDSSPSRFGVFSNPAVLADVAGFTPPHDDVQNLAHCQPGSCKVKLPGLSITTLRAMLDSSSTSRDSVASAYMAQRMVDYVTAYRSRGNAALVVYADQRTPTPAEQIWDAMLSESPYVYAATPELARYLADYPQDRPPGAHDSIFWTASDIPGAQPLLTVTHQVTYNPPELSGTTVIASKQLYCDHYLDGAFDLMEVIDATPQAQAQSTAVDVLFIRRLHFDDLPSGGILNIRGKVIGKFRDETRDVLENTKRSSEQAFAGAH